MGFVYRVTCWDTYFGQLLGDMPWITAASSVHSTSFCFVVLFVLQNFRSVVLLCISHQFTGWNCFPFWNILFCFKIFCYANDKTDNVIGGSIKTRQHSRLSLEKKKQCSLNLAPEMYITSKREWHPLWCCHGNTLGSSLFLQKNKYPHLQPFLSWAAQRFPYCLNPPH